MRWPRLRSKFQNKPWIKVGEIWIGGNDKIGGTPIGLIRAIARTRAYYLERHSIPESTVIPVVFPYWFLAAYGLDMNRDPGQHHPDPAIATENGLKLLIRQLRDIGVKVEFGEWQRRHWWERHPKPWARWGAG